MAERIIEKDSVRMYELDQSKYAIVTNRRRMIAEIRDGLIPVQRRILYAALKQHLISPKDNAKSATLVGYIIGKLHCHGDSSAYGAIGTMASWYKMKYPLTFGEGNWGNLQGAGPAAMRYTHCSLSDFGYEVMIEELSKSNNVVDWVETFERNGSLEPEYLPAKLPMLLLNGAFGIGVGLQLNIPSFNLLEVADVLHNLLKNPKYKFTLIPDLCQPCTLIGNAETWQELNEVGRASFKIRGHIVTEQDKKGDYILHIVSLPDNVNTTMVYDKIMKLIEDKQLPMIKDIYNSLNDERPDIIIHLRPGSDPEYVKQALYAKTSVQQSFTVNFEAVSANGIDIKRFDFRTYLLSFIDQRMTTKFRLYCNLLQQVMTRHHQVDAFVKVLESGEIDTIINMIKKSKGDDNDIIEYIIKKCHLTDIQAKFIISVNLSRLSLAHLNGYRAERKDLEAKIKEYEAKVTDDGSLIKKEIDEEIQYLAKKYGSPRICDVVADDVDNNIPAGTFKVVITEKNFIRKLVDSDKINIVRKDNPKFICRIDNREAILVFDAKGKCYNIPVNSIPVTDKQAPGTDSRLLVKNLTADIVSMVPLSSVETILANKNAKYYFVVLTKSNCIKKLDLEDFTNVNKTGLIYTKVKDDLDEVVSVKLVPATLDVCISSGKKALRFAMKDIPILKRIAGGVKAIDTNEPITSMVELYDQCTDIVVVTKNGKLNRFNAVMLSPHKRGSKGSGVCKLDTNDSVLTILGCREQDKVKIITTEEVIEINVADIKLKSPLAPAQKVVPIKGVIIRAEAVY